MASNPYDPGGPEQPDGYGLEPNPDNRNLAMIAHLSGCAGVLGAGFLGFVGPLIIYLTKKDSPYVVAQSKEALNFQITMLLLAILCGGITAISCGLLFPVIFIPMVLQLVYGIIAALAVRDGSSYRYPMNLRLLQ